MSDPSFEHGLARLFAEPPVFSDTAAFTAAVQARLERGWRLRRLLIGAAGGAGGVIAAGQLLEANLVQRASAATQSADARAHDVAFELVAHATALLHAYAPAANGEVLWMVAGLGAVGLALIAARVMERL